jgi:hypothetical protein
MSHFPDIPVIPTVPFWDFTQFSAEKWKEQIQKRFAAEGGEIAVYIHLPFCEELCTYCACNKRITKNHAVEEPYLQGCIKRMEDLQENVSVNTCDKGIASWWRYTYFFFSSPSTGIDIRNFRRLQTEQQSYFQCGTAS